MPREIESELMNNIGKVHNLLVVVVGGLVLADVMHLHESGFFIKFIDQALYESVALRA